LKASSHGSEYLLTDPFMVTGFLIYVTHKKRNEIRRPVDLSGKRVAALRAHRAQAEYLAGIGGVQTVVTDYPLEQMQKVASGEADALIENAAAVNLVKNELSLKRLTVAATTPSLMENLVVLNKSGEHLLAMINDILDLSKIEAERTELKEQAFDWVALIKEMSVMIQSRAMEKVIAV
jgi:ABC-type amino acid transport substrate-binding protein